MKIKVEKIAKELLLEEDCVVIPEFGGFVSSYRAAINEPSKNILLPPGKHISFNAKLSKNDGLLAKYISEKLGITYKEALESIEVRVEFWRNELETKHYLEFENLGSFILNNEGNLVFEQFNETNFLDTSFGLTNVHAIPVERIGLSQKIERGLTNNKAQPKVYKVIMRTAVAACVAALVFTGLNYSQDNDNTTTKMNMVSIGSSSVEQNDVIVGQSNAFAIVVEKPLEVVKGAKILFNKNEKQLLEDVGAIGDNVNLKVVKALKEEKEAREKLFEVASTEVTTKIADLVSKDVSNNYHVIAGCFGVKGNATNMVRSLKAKGYPAVLAGKSNSGLFRVAYGSFGTRLKALKALAKAKLTHNSKAWIAKD
jgi:nucleoid DNA-binding protein